MKKCVARVVDGVVDLLLRGKRYLRDLKFFTLLPYVQTGLGAALALRDARLDGHDTDILALQTAGPFATSSDLTAAETSLQSAIDAVLAQLAALTTGGGNLINAQA